MNKNFKIPYKEIEEFLRENLIKSSIEKILIIEI